MNVDFNEFVKRAIKYIIEGISFYIPNYGSILLIDTQFKDLDVNGLMPNIQNEFNNCRDDEYHLKSEEHFRYKIMMSGVFDNSDQTKRAIDRRNDELFRTKIFDSNAFGSRADSHAGAIPLDTPINDLVTSIGNGGYNKIDNIIKNHPHYLHNRVGTLLNESEKKNIVPNKYDFKPGDLIGYSDNDPLNYYIAVFIKDIPNGIVIETDNLIGFGSSAALAAAPVVAAPAPAVVPAPAAPVAPAPAPAPAAPVAPAPAPAVVPAPVAAPVVVAAPAVVLPPKAKIITIDRTDPKRIIANILTVEYVSTVFINENIKQSYKPNYKLSDEELIEKYEIKFE